MSATMRREWTSEVDERVSAVEVEVFSTMPASSVTVDDVADPELAQQLAALETILVDYRPVFAELANR